LDLSLTPDSFKPKVGPNKWGKQTIEEYSKQYWLSQDIAMLQAALWTHSAVARHGSAPPAQPVCSCALVAAHV
jgi:hypothetical protein